MGLVFWIDDNDFVTSLIKKVFLAQGIDFYTIDSAKDFSYLINDLRPEYVVISSQTAIRDLDLFKKQYEDTHGFNNAKIVIIDSCDELDFLENRYGELKTPLSPFTLKDFFLRAQSER